MELQLANTSHELPHSQTGTDHGGGRGTLDRVVSRGQKGTSKGQVVVEEEEEQQEK